MTINQINNNPAFAPIGHEEEFKRRIFLDNFRRCMTIRQFQKTAGLEIKKKVEATPTALAMREVIDYYWEEHLKIILKRITKDTLNYILLKKVIMKL